MTDDQSDHQPDLPDERPLPDQARAVRRAELLRRADGAGRTASGTRGWVPVAVAAAAGVAVVGLGSALLVGAIGADDDAPVPIGTTTAVPSAEPRPEDVTAPPSSPAVDAPDDDPSDPLPSEEGLDQVPTPSDARACSALRQTRGAEEQGAIEIGPTTVRLYVNGPVTWFVCDEWAALDGGEATLLPSHRLGTPLQRDQLVLSMNFSMEEATVGQYVAGGALPDDSVTAISYAFPDGHTEQAVVEDGMWAMAYFATEGPLSGTGRVPPNAETTVTVDYADGSQQSHVLGFPFDFCAQTNHGC